MIRFWLALLAAGCLFSGVASAQGEEAAEWYDRSFEIRKAVRINEAATFSADRDRYALGLRLSPSSFNFAKAGPNGEDIRVVAEGRELPFYLESFDPVTGLVSLWVSAPVGVSPIYIYYGNDDAESRSDPAAVFRPDSVFVYDFSGLEREVPAPGGADALSPEQSVADLMGDGPDATGRFTVRPGLSGLSAEFAGADILRTPGGTLPQAGPRTLSFWVKPVQGADGVLVARRLDPEAGDRTAEQTEDDDMRDAYALRLSEGRLTLEIGGEALGLPPQDDENGQNDEVETSQADAPVGAPLEEGAWSHVAIVFGPGSASLIVDGDVAVAAAASPPAARGPLVFGEGFEGQIDHIRYVTGARGVGGLILEAGADQMENIVQFGPEEERKSFFDLSYFETVVRNVTLEGWFAIALCMLLLVRAVLVMIGKFGLIDRIEKANAAFNAMPGSQTLPIKIADGTETHPELKIPKNSTLGEIYKALEEDLKEELSDGWEISAVTIGAIQQRLALLNQRQANRISRGLVMLTAAIAGGPLIGLFGTVVGVMITFAAIAAEGSVSVNAIAPGVAASLLSTVAGLMAAIPSLFAYNGITTRAKAINQINRGYTAVMISRLANDVNR